MSKLYTVLLTIAVTVVSVSGVSFSVAGLISLFGGAPLSVAVMSTGLELSKFVVVGFIYRYWGHIHKPLRVYLIFSICVLMIITSTGIYGYLTNAYQIAATDWHSHNMIIQSMENENTRVLAQMDEMKAFIDQIPKSRISRKFEFQKQYEPQMKALRHQSESLIKKIDDKKMELLSLQTKVGPIVYLARALGVDIDTAVKYVIMLFVSVFDPLAVCLVFCLNLLIRLREKYRNDEYKIGARSLTNPVDHRFRKSA
jgi:hypothetical protein